jgi:hypothetical protein
VRPTEIHSWQANSNLQVKSLHMEHTNYKTKLSVSLSNNTHQSRFKILLFIFRLGGLPIMMKSTSKINTLYNVLIAVCFYSTAACLFMDMFVHRRQLVYVMKKLRAFTTFVLAAWILISCRYAVLGYTFMEIRAISL